MRSAKPAKPHRKRYKSFLERDVAALLKGADFTAYGKHKREAQTGDKQADVNKNAQDEADLKRRVHVWYELPSQEISGDSSELGTLYWCDISLKQMKPQSLEESLPVGSLRQLIQGKETKALQSEAADTALDDNCLSIVSDSFALSLEAASNPVITAWMRGLGSLLNSAGKAVRELTSEAAAAAPPHHAPATPPAASPQGGEEQAAAETGGLATRHRRRHSRKETRVFSVVDACSQLAAEAEAVEASAQATSAGAQRGEASSSLNKLILKHSRKPTQGAFMAAWRAPETPRGTPPAQPTHTHTAPTAASLPRGQTPPPLPSSTPLHKTPKSLLQRVRRPSWTRQHDSSATPATPASPPLPPPSSPTHASQPSPSPPAAPTVTPLMDKPMPLCCKRARQVLSERELTALSAFTGGRLDTASEAEMGSFFRRLRGMRRKKWFAVLDCYVIAIFQSVSFLNNLIHQHNWTRWILPLMLAAPSSSSDEAAEDEGGGGGDQREEMEAGEERKLFDYLMLLVVELHAHCFHKSNEGQFGSAKMAHFLNTSLELVRSATGLVGGNTHAATVNRLILWTLLNKISGYRGARPAWAQGDVKRAAWINLFPLLSCVETFIFFETGEDVGGEVLQLLEGRSSKAKRVTLHLDKHSLDCLDLPLVEKVVGLLTYLKIDQLDACPAMDAQSRKLQKLYKQKGMEELKFYTLVQKFFQAFSSVSAETSTLRRELEVGTSPLIATLATRGKGRYGTKKELTLAFRDLVKRCVRKQQSGIAAIASYAANRYLEATGSALGGNRCSLRASAAKVQALGSLEDEAASKGGGLGGGGGGGRVALRGLAGTTHSTSAARDVVLSFAQKRFGGDKRSWRKGGPGGRGGPVGAQQPPGFSRRDTAFARPTLTAAQKYTHCALHRKPFEYHCQEDGQLVCSSCLLRGAHQKHRYQEIEKWLAGFRKDQVSGKVAKLRSKLGQAERRLKVIAGSMHNLISQEAPLVKAIKSDADLLLSLLRSSLRQLRKSMLSKCKSPHVPKLEKRISQTRTFLRHIEEWENNMLPLTKPRSPSNADTRLPPWAPSLMHIHSLASELAAQPAVESLASPPPPTLKIDISDEALERLIRAIASHGRIDFVDFQASDPSTPGDAPKFHDVPQALIPLDSLVSVVSEQQKTTPPFIRMVSDLSSGSEMNTPLSSGDFGTPANASGGSGRFSARAKRLSILKQRSASILQNPPPALRPQSGGQSVNGAD